MSELVNKFNVYHAESPQVWWLFEKYALELAGSNVTALSAKRIFERIRWESDVSGNDGYKVNNNYTPFYARMFETKYPDAPKFRKRKSKADSLFPDLDMNFSYPDHDMGGVYDLETKPVGFLQKIWNRFKMVFGW